MSRIPPLFVYIGSCSCRSRELLLTAFLGLWLTNLLSFLCTMFRTLIWKWKKTIFLSFRRQKFVLKNYIDTHKILCIWLQKPQIDHKFVYNFFFRIEQVSKHSRHDFFKDFNWFSKFCLIKRCDFLLILEQIFYIFDICIKFFSNLILFIIIFFA